MKRKLLNCVLLLLPATMSLAGQTAAKPQRSSLIESRQGNHPDGPDMVGHGTLFAGDTVLCSQVEVYDESHQASTACMVQFADGPKHTLSFNESMPAPQDCEALLECAGAKPRRCMVEGSPRSVKQSSDIQ